MAYTHTIYPGFLPSGYFDNDNVDFIHKKIIEVLHQNFTQDIMIPKGDIKKIMLRILSERLEEIPMMNQRVIMTIVNEFRNHELDVRKAVRQLATGLTLREPRLDRVVVDGRNDGRTARIRAGEQQHRGRQQGPEATGVCERPPQSSRSNSRSD